MSVSWLPSMEVGWCLKPFSGWFRVLTMKRFLLVLLLLRMRVGYHVIWNIVPQSEKYPWWLVLVLLFTIALNYWWEIISSPPKIVCLRSAYRYISWLLAHEDSQVFAFPYTVQLSSLLLIICCCSQLAGSSRAYIQESSFLLRRKTIHLFCQQIIFQRLQFPWTGVKKYEIYFSHGLLQDECTKCSVDCHWYHLVSVLLVKCELHGLWIVTFDVFYRY